MDSAQAEDNDNTDIAEFDSDPPSDPEDDSNMLNMLEAYSTANSVQKGL